MATNLVEHVDPKSLLFKQLRVDNLTKKIRVIDENIYSLQESIVTGAGSIGPNWLESMPIESLMDLYNVENGLPTQNMSLKVIAEKKSLQKKHKKLLIDREIVEEELRKAKIELLLSQIEDIL